jgi:hypothetical protein
MTTAVIDVDWIRYAAGFAGEKKTIQTIQKATGEVRTFKNVTEFYGRGKAKDKGWLGEWNAANPDNPLVFDDFDLLEIQKPEPIANVLHSVKSMVHKAVEAVDADKFILYFGRGDSFRVERSTILKYKGNRESTKKPVLLPEITEYLEKHMGAIPVTGIEADDQCIITAYKKKDHIVVSPDKDTGGCDVLWANPMRVLENGKYEVFDCSGLGKLWIEETVGSKGEVYKHVRGTGQKFFLWQVAFGDDVDLYRANGASEVPWGPLSAYDVLVDTKTFREGLEAVVGVYKHLYPEPVQVEGWRGDIITVDWLYAMHEIFDLARMYRWEGDEVHLPDVLKKYDLL